MKTTILLFIAVATQLASFAQGTIVFANRNIPIASGGTTGGGNGNGTYNVPIYYDSFLLGGPGPVGAGSLAGGFKVGLFQVNASDSAPPLASTLLRTDANSQFFATASQTVTIPGFEAGQTANLLVRGWQGSGGFGAAKASPNLIWGEWAFTSKPLGGTPAGGGLPITPPGMTGWGPESGAGLTIVLIPEPTPAALVGLAAGAAVLLRRRINPNQ